METLLKDLALLSRIADCNGRITLYTKGDPQMMLNNELVLSAVEWNLHVLAQCAAHLSTDAKVLSESIDWKRIGELHHRILYKYLELQAAEIIAFVREELPGLASAFEDTEDILTIEQAKRENGDHLGVPLHEVRKQLGLD